MYKKEEMQLFGSNLVVVVVCKWHEDLLPFPPAGEDSRGEGLGAKDF